METRKFINAYELARLTGLSAGWLKREAREKRLPHIREGQRYMFNLDSVETMLLERASANSEGGTSAD